VARIDVSDTNDSAVVHVSSFIFASLLSTLCSSLTLCSVAQVNIMVWYGEDPDQSLALVPRHDMCHVTSHARITVSMSFRHIR